MASQEDHGTDTIVIQQGMGSSPEDGGQVMNKGVLGHIPRFHAWQMQAVDDTLRGLRFCSRNLPECFPGHKLAYRLPDLEGPDPRDRDLLAQAGLRKLDVSPYKRALILGFEGTGLDRRHGFLVSNCEI